MNTTDPIADMLTRIRNASAAKHKTVDVPASKMKKAIADILYNEGYIKSVEEIANENQGILRIALKYDENGAKVIAGIKRISKPGLRVYASAEKLPKVLNGLGIALISTSKGIKTDKEARKENLGGEVFKALACYKFSIQCEEAHCNPINTRRREKRNVKNRKCTCCNTRRC